MGKPTKQGGGYVSENSRGDRFASGNATRSSVDRSNHLHFHKDGVTVTHEGRKTSVLTFWCSRCEKDTKHTERKDSEGTKRMLCAKCGR